MISLEEFKRMDLRVGEIASADRIPGSDRLLRLEVDVGGERRVLVGGLAASYRGEELLGLKVIVLMNLEPATIRGIVSQGMLLGAACSGAAPALLTVNRPVPSGTHVQ